jgi:hypothetical protein
VIKQPPHRVDDPGVTRCAPASLATVPVEPPDPTIAPGAPGARRRTRFRAAVPRALYLAVVLSALTAVSAWALASGLPGSRPATNVAPPVLSSDDGGAALFQLADLAPGKAESRCISVSYDGPGRADLRLVASAAGSGLAKFLQLRVEEGSGGGFGDCSGFAGAPLFDGSLAEFVGLHHDYDSGLAALAPAPTGSTTFRLRMALDDVAAPQAGTATASFAWEARPDAPIAVAARPAPAQPGGPDADASPSPQRPAPDAEARPAPGTPDGGRAAPSTAPSPAAAEPSGRAQPRRHSSRPPGQTQRPAPSVTAGDAPRAARRSPPAPGRVSRLVKAISKLVAPVVQRTAFPLILLIVAGLFLLVQDRIDRRDPKLARAPLHARPDLPFLPPPSPGDVRP